MADEGKRPIAGGLHAPENRADAGEPSIVTDEAVQLVAGIAQSLRAAGLGCEILSSVPVEASVLRRDRVVAILALLLLAALAWSYLLWLSADMAMGGMDMTGWRMIPSGMALMMPADMPWTAMEFAFVFAMWIVMMTAMMTPSAVPMILMYARLGRQTDAKCTPLAATVWFAVGYFLVWVAFALLATVVQWALERAALLDFRMATTNNVLGACLFVAAGSYQWTRLKDECLVRCQSPFAFLMRQGGYRRDMSDCVLLGIRYGAYCIGCCWTLVALLLIGGVMNVLWIALLALLILLERTTLRGRLIAHFAGTALVATGVWLLST